MDKDLFLGRDFGVAACQQFGLDGSRVLKAELYSQLDEVLAVDFRITVTAQDLAEIAKHMNAMVQV